MFVRFVCFFRLDFKMFDKLHARSHGEFEELPELPELNEAPQKKSMGRD